MGWWRRCAAMIVGDRRDAGTWRTAGGSSGTIRRLTAARRSTPRPRRRFHGRPYCRRIRGSRETEAGGPHPTNRGGNDWDRGWRAGGCGPWAPPSPRRSRPGHPSRRAEAGKRWRQHGLRHPEPDRDLRGLEVVVVRLRRGERGDEAVMHADGGVDQGGVDPEQGSGSSARYAAPVSDTTPGPARTALMRRIARSAAAPSPKTIAQLAPSVRRRRARIGSEVGVGVHPGCDRRVRDLHQQGAGAAGQHDGLAVDPPRDGSGLEQADARLRWAKAAARARDRSVGEERVMRSPTRICPPARTSARRPPRPEPSDAGMGERLEMVAGCILDP